MIIFHTPEHALDEPLCLVSDDRAASACIVTKRRVALLTRFVVSSSQVWDCMGLEPVHRKTNRTSS